MTMILTTMTIYCYHLLANNKKRIPFRRRATAALRSEANAPLRTRWFLKRWDDEIPHRQGRSFGPGKSERKWCHIYPFLFSFSNNLYAYNQPDLCFFFLWYSTFYLCTATKSSLQNPWPRKRWLCQRMLSPMLTIPAFQWIWTYFPGEKVLKVEIVVAHGIMLEFDDTWFKKRVW